MVNSHPLDLSIAFYHTDHEIDIPSVTDDKNPEEYTKMIKSFLKENTQFLNNLSTLDQEQLPEAEPKQGRGYAGEWLKAF